MAPVIIYGMPLSAPCRILFMTCEVLGIEYEVKIVDLNKGDNKTPEYLKLNPQHTVPTLVDGDFVANESRPAMTYLVQKYGGERKDQLYPENVEARCKVDQRLFFDMGSLYASFGECVYPIMFGPMSEVSKEKEARLLEVLGWLNNFVKQGGFAAGSNFTVADIAILSSYSSISATGVVALDQFTELNEWFDKCKALVPNYEKANAEGAAMFGGIFKTAFASKNQ